MYLESSFAKKGIELPEVTIFVWMSAPVRLMLYHWLSVVTQRFWKETLKLSLMATNSHFVEESILLLKELIIFVQGHGSLVEVTSSTGVTTFDTSRTQKVCTKKLLKSYLFFSPEIVPDAF